jgi:hypothetical protein
VPHALRSEGLKAVRKEKRLTLKSEHRKARLHFAKHHLHWTVDAWQWGIFSDETKVNHLGPDGIKWAWKKPGEGLSDHLVEPAVKFGGGSLMMWGCMLWEGVGYATKIEGSLDAKLYTSILEYELQLRYCAVKKPSSLGIRFRTMSPRCHFNPILYPDHRLPVRT